MAAHRYWRITFNASNGQSTPSCAELQFRAVNGGPHIPGTTTVSSNWNAGTNPLTNMFDGNPATWWAGNSGANTWIKIDYGAGNEQEIIEISWTSRSDSGAQSPGKWVFEYSDNDSTWTEWASSGKSQIAWTNGQTQVWDLLDGGNSGVGAIAVEHHSAQEPNAQPGAIALEVHARASPPITDAQVGAIALEVHASILIVTSAQVGSIGVEVHTSINERPHDTLPVPPEAKVVERLEWLTDILPNYDGTEQRISVRAMPRRSFTYDLTVLDDKERKTLYDILYNSADWDFNAPAYPYQAWVKQKSVAGQSILYFNVARSDLRENDPFLVQLKDGRQFVYVVQSWAPDHVVIGRQLEADVGVGSIVMPVYLSRLQGSPALGMASIAGSSNLTALILRPRPQEAWPGAPMALPTFDGWTLLDRRPLGQGEAPEEFDAGVETIDNITGIPAYYTAWLQKYVGGNRSYLINRLFDPNEIQFWRTFLDYCRGRQRAFLTSTYRNDLYLATGAVLNPTDVTVQGKAYARFYRKSETYRRLEIVTDMGTLRVKVATASYSAGVTTITFVDPITEDISGATVERISYLMLARLGSDTVTLNHEDGFTTVETSLRAVVE